MTELPSITFYLALGLSAQLLQFVIGLLDMRGITWYQCVGGHYVVQNCPRWRLGFGYFREKILKLSLASFLTRTLKRIYVHSYHIRTDYLS